MGRSMKTQSKHGLVLLPRLLEPFEQAALPGDFAPGDVGRLEGFDLGL